MDNLEKLNYNPDEWYLTVQPDDIHADKKEKKEPKPKKKKGDCSIIFNILYIVFFLLGIGVFVLLFQIDPLVLDITSYAGIVFAVEICIFIVISLLKKKSKKKNCTDDSVNE